MRPRDFNYFTFLFVHVFLTGSLSAGVTTIFGELTDTIGAVPAVLAQNLPKACNYFFSYIMIYTISSIVSTLLEVNGLINLLILSPMFDKTARQMWTRGQNLGLQKYSNSALRSTHPYNYSHLSSLHVVSPCLDISASQLQ